MGHLPGPAALEVLVSERPGPALQRPHGIHAARALREANHLPVDAALGRLFLQEDAVVQARGTALLLEADPPADLPAEPRQRRLDRQLHVLGEPLDLLAADPHVAWPARAAVAALRACELESAGIPRSRARIVALT